MEIIEKDIKDLIPYENNPRINDEAVQYVAESIKQFGFKVPMVIDKNNVIVAGHTRYKASEMLGLTKIPCIIADDLTEEQIKAYRLADNKVAENSKWDIDKLDEELANIIDIDMTDLGFEKNIELNLNDFFEEKINTKLIVCNCVFIVSLIIANIVASKIVVLGGLVIPSAIVAYPITFLMTDVIGELWGKKEANKTVKTGILCQILSLILISLAILLPVAPFANNQKEFTLILGNSARVIIASLVAYVCSQSWDVWIFHKIRDKYIKKHGSTKGGRWIWNNASTMTSQIIDTVIFITVAFWGKVPNILTMILSQYFIKFIFALCDTPFFYLLTNKKISR